MFFVGWTNRNGRTDVGAVRSSALLKQLAEKNMYPQIIDIWKQGSRISQIKWAARFLKKMIVNKPQIVYVSCNPYNHLLVVLLGVILGRHKLIVDFRDAYSIDIKERNYPGCYQLARFTEKLIYKFCEKLILVTPGIEKRYENIFGNADKLMVVPNGHELSKALLEQLAGNRKNNNEIKVVYPGMYSPYFSSVQARKYIGILSDELKKTGKKHEIIFVGTDKGTKALLKDEECVRFIPDTAGSERLPYEETIRILNEADLVFMPIDNDYGCATKIYDYLALGLPIFNFIDKNNWLHQYIAGRIVDSCENLHRFEMDYEGKYHRDNQMKKLANYIYEEARKINDPAYREEQ